MLDKIIEKMNEIPIFFEDEKKYLISQIKNSTPERQKEIYKELLFMEKKVKEDWPEISKQLKEISDKQTLEIETKKNEIMKDLIKKSEEKDEDEEIDLDSAF